MEWAALLAGSFIALLSAGAGAAFARRFEKEKESSEILFDVYMLLMELHSSYFWLSSAEVRMVKPRRAQLHSVKDKAWRIADILRKIDHDPIVEELLDVLMHDDMEKYPTFSKRHDAIGKLLEKLGDVVNPRYKAKVREISETNITTRAHIDDWSKLNAPGTLDPMFGEPDPSPQDSYEAQQNKES